MCPKDFFWETQVAINPRLSEKGLFRSPPVCKFQLARALRDDAFWIPKWLSPPLIPCSPLQISRRDWQSAIWQNNRAIRCVHVSRVWQYLSVCRFFAAETTMVRSIKLATWEKRCTVLMEGVFFEATPVYDLLVRKTTFHFFCPDFCCFAIV